ncbi:MAG: response regulator transcription factor [Oligoflexales bacterium]
MKKILIIDDHMDTVDYIADTLEEKYDVLTAYDGAQGLEHVRKNHPDLILLDLIMHIVDGFQFMDELEREGINIPIIVVTGAPKHKLQKLAHYKVNDVVFKPFTEDVFLIKIDLILKLATGER